ncbi:MAG TPA: 4-aminobutyrate--2-oxoglutarate transaminase [Parafilimonas sp.]|nr:4-aminobutyrate--2-oxoglutarate transaminase [Parafilimonas sp.]
MPTINLVTKIPGPNSEAILERRRNALPAGLAKSTEVVVAKAEGGVVWDVDGNTLLDFAGGIGMINVGHRPQQVVDAIKAQLDKYIHTCSLVTTYEPYVELAEMLNRLTPGSFPKKTLLCNTGTEAVENAVMLAKYYTKRPAIICFEGAYHGRSLLTLSLTSKYSLFKKGFGSFVSDIYRLPAPNVYRTPDGMTEDEYIQSCIKNLEHAFIAQVEPESVAAMIIEPVLGEGGFVQMPAAFMHKIREVCDQYGIVMIADEIQCGSARTGKLFAIEHAGVAPDLMTIAKSLGAGMPVSAVVGKAQIMDCTHPGGIGGTYGGSPVAAVAAIEALKILSSKEFLERAVHVGELIKSKLDRWKEKFPLVGDVRATGAMCIVEFVKDKQTKEPDIELPLEVLKDAVVHGIILIRAGLYSNCIRLLPPIVMTDEQLHEGLQVLEDAIERAHEKRKK